MVPMMELAFKDFLAPIGSWMAVCYGLGKPLCCSLGKPPPLPSQVLEVLTPDLVYELIAHEESATFEEQKVKQIPCYDRQEPTENTALVGRGIKPSTVILSKNLKGRNTSQSDAENRRNSFLLGIRVGSRFHSRQKMKPNRAAAFV